MQIAGASLQRRIGHALRSGEDSTFDDGTNCVTCEAGKFFSIKQRAGQTGFPGLTAFKTDSPCCAAIPLSSGGDRCSLHGSDRRDRAATAAGAAHRRCTGFVDARAVAGHVFQGRSGRVAMDDAHVPNAVRTLAFSPVRAGLAATPEGWPWPGVAAQLARRDDAPVPVAPVLARVLRFGDLTDLPLAGQMALEGFETKSANARPPGLPAFVAMVEKRPGRSLTPGQPGRKRKAAPPAATPGVDRRRHRGEK